MSHLILNLSSEYEWTCYSQVHVWNLPSKDEDPLMTNNSTKHLSNKLLNKELYTFIS